MYINEFNPHWKENFSYTIPFQRDDFTTVRESIKQKHITNIIGIRRVGKTTIIKQIIDDLINNTSVPRDHIFFYSYDIEKDIQTSIQEFQNITNIDLNTEKTYLFFDEIQKVKNRQSYIKILYDMYPKTTIITSWSSMLHLQKRESLAGRIHDIVIPPLRFSEFLAYQKNDSRLKQPNIYTKELIYTLEQYLWRQFIDTIHLTDNQTFEYMNTLISKIIKEDIAFYFPIDYPDVLLRIFNIIAQSPGMMLDYKNFANDLDIDQRTLEKYIYYLQEWWLIRKIYNYSPNLIKSERKLKKVYLQSTSFARKTTITSELFENYIINLLQGEYFRRVGQQEVDCILVKNTNTIQPNIIWYEIKYTDKITKKTYTWIKALDSKYGITHWYIISKSITKQREKYKTLPRRELSR